MVFPNKWSMPKNITEEGQIVGFDSEDPNMKGVSFVAAIDEKEVSLIIGKIGKIIKMNKERELKEKLFKQTVDQLKQTFEKNGLDKLQNLYFDFEETEPEIELINQNEQESTSIELVDE